MTAPLGPADRTTFFEEQARHRRRTRRFGFFAAVAVILAGIPVSLLATPILYLVALTTAHLVQLATPLPPDFWTTVAEVGRVIPVAVTQIERAVTLRSFTPIDWAALGTMAAILAAPGMALMFLLWLWVRVLFRRAGTEGILLRIHARAPNEKDLEEQQLVNVIHEMAIAGGVRPPTVRILDQAVPNAAILGRDLNDATVVVTRGLLDTLSREETQGVIAHLIGSVGNGDLRMATSLLSVWQTFGLLSVILAVPSAGGARRRLWETVRAMFRRADHADRERVALLLATDEVDPSGGANHGCLALLAAPFAMVGLTIQLLTSLGTMLFFGPLLTAVWRTRRFLADQTAVQLTRNPNGIAHALQRLERGAMVVDGGATSALVFLHWPSSVTAKGWPSLGRFHPSLAKRIHRLEATGARRLRFSLEGPTPSGRRRGRPWLAPIGWLLMGLVYALMAVGFVAAFAGAALLMGLSFGFVGMALLLIHAFFTGLPQIIEFVTSDLPKIGTAIVGLAQELWARR